MATDLSDSTALQRSPTPGQFSLAAIFIVTAAVAFVLGIIFVFPDWLAGIAVLFLMFAVPAALVVGAKFGPANWTAFCVGALVPMATILIGLAFTIFMFVQEPTAMARGAASRFTSPPNGDRLEPYGEWLIACVRIGIVWRSIVFTTWAFAILNGILCVGVRRFILRRKGA